MRTKAECSLATLSTHLHLEHKEKPGRSHDPLSFKLDPPAAAGEPRDPHLLIPRFGTSLKARLPNKKQEESPLLSTQLPPEKRTRSPRGGGYRRGSGWEPPLPGCSPRGCRGDAKEKAGRPGGARALCLCSEQSKPGGAGGRGFRVQASTAVLPPEWEVLQLLLKGWGRAKDKSGERSSRVLPLQKPPEPATAGAAGTLPPAGFAGGRVPLLFFPSLPAPDRHG